MDAIKEWLKVPATLKQGLAELRKLHRDLHLANIELTRVTARLHALDAVIGEMQPLRDAMLTMEAAGIRRKFGGVIDVDYDRLLDTLGWDDETELLRTIQLRRKAHTARVRRAMKKKTAKPAAEARALQVVK